MAPKRLSESEKFHFYWIQHEKLHLELLLSIAFSLPSGRKKIKFADFFFGKRVQKSYRKKVVLAWTT